MKQLKLSFALIIAVLAIGVTFVTKANQIGSGIVTACFEQVVITNDAGTLQYNPVLDAADCLEARTEIAALGRTWLDIDLTSLSPVTNCGDEEVIYCCITFEEDNANAPAPIDPHFVPGSGTEKFKVIAVECKPAN